MKPLLFLAILFCCSLSAETQNTEVDLNLEYYVNQNGKEKTGKLYKYNNQCLFYYEPIESTDIEQSEYDENGIQKWSVELKSGNKIHGTVISSFEKEEMLSQVHVFHEGEYSEFIVFETLKMIPWKLTSETKTINNFNCRKATADVRGRSYTCWYAQDIPVIYGPWKLHGLPGVIVEAYDAERFITFSLTKVNTNSVEIPDSLVEMIYKDENFISCEEYLTLKDNQVNEMIKHIQTKLPRGAFFSVDKTEKNWLEKSCE